MEKRYHIGFNEEHGAKYAILPGDPARVERIAAYLEHPRFYAQNREYTTWLGEIDGTPVLVMSTGMGGPSTAIGVEELHQVGVETAIRIGTCGGIALPVQGGDLVVANGAIRMEGTSREYVPIEFPAVPDFDVTVALVEAAKACAQQAVLAYEPQVHVGVVQCKDSFYGQHDPKRMPVSYELLNKWEAWKRAGTLASEMESAALFTVGATLGMRTGCILSCIWNKDREQLGQPSREVHDPGLACQAAVEAIRLLIRS